MEIMFVFRHEEVKRGKRGDLRGEGAHEPVQKIYVMTAFLQNVRSRIFRVSAPVRHDVSAVSGSDVLVCVDAVQLSEHA